MLQSMTGYGSSVIEIGSRTFSIELKGVNHRYLDIKIRLPRDYYQFEEAIRKEIAKYVSRGRVDVFIHYEKGVETEKEIVIDYKLAQQYFEQLSKLGEAIGSDKLPTLDFIANRPDVIIMQEGEEDLEQTETLLQKAVADAAERFAKMRQVEAKNLVETIKQQLFELETLRQQVLGRAPQVVAEYRLKLQERISALLDNNVEINQDKLCNEVAFFADRASIDEELVRLNSHIQQFTKLLDSNNAVGRKMDFLVQEMNREVNTIGSKSSDIEISRSVVDMKAVIEKIREQVQNIE